jgi:hypothetical protein
MLNTNNSQNNINQSIIIGKTTLFEPQPSLEDSAGLHPVFTFFHFA